MTPETPVDRDKEAKIRKLRKESLVLAIQVLAVCVGSITLMWGIAQFVTWLTQTLGWEAAGYVIVGGFFTAFAIFMGVAHYHDEKRKL